MFRFAIRDVLWLMVVAAVAAAWWSDRIKWQERQGTLEKSHAELNEFKQALGGEEVAAAFLKKMKAVRQRSLPLRSPSSSPSAAVPSAIPPNLNRSRSGKVIPTGQLEAERGVYFLGP